MFNCALFVAKLQLMCTAQSCRRLVLKGLTKNMHMAYAITTEEKAKERYDIRVHLYLILFKILKTINEYWTHKLGLEEDHVSVIVILVENIDKKRSRYCS